MKPMLLFFSLLITVAGFSQERFQGTIVYHLHLDKDETELFLTISYGPNKIKLVGKENTNSDVNREYILIDLDSGKVFTVKERRKTFRAKKLFDKNIVNIKPSERKIAGYPTKPIVLNDEGFSGKLAMFFSGTSIFDVANDLYYPIPEKFSSNPELTMVRNNHIVLGITLFAPDVYSPALPDSMSVLKITAEAISVTKEKIDPSIFQLPSDYKLETYSDIIQADSVAMPDSISMMLDTAMYVPKVDEEIKENQTEKPSSPVKKTPTKTPAIKPKKTKG